MSIELDIDGTGTVSAAVLDRQEEDSPHTGRAIRRLEVQFRTGSEQAREHVSAALSAGKVTGTSDDGATFTVANHSHSYQHGSDVTTFTVTVEEVEPLSCDRVVLDGAVELVPEQYQEEFRDGAVGVYLTATTLGPETEAFEALLLDHDPPHYFLVVRHGISETPMTMRFGRCLYRDRDDGTREHKVVLVQDVYDDRDELPFKGFHQPEMRRAEEAIVALQGTVGRLLDVLVASDVLRKEQAAAVRDDASLDVRRARRQFDRSEDDDDFTVS